MSIIAGLQPVSTTKIVVYRGAPYVHPEDRERAYRGETEGIRLLSSYSVTFDQSSVWLLSNEKNIEGTLAKLERLPKKGSSFIGVGALTSLDMAARRSHLKSIYLFDCAAKVEAFWGSILPILKQHAKKEEALASIRTKILENPQLFSIYVEGFARQVGSQSFVDQLNQWIVQGHSFLSHDDLYQRIHRLAQADAIVFHRVDLSDPVSARAIENHFFTRSVDLIYFSNIPICLPKEEERKTVANLRKHLQQRWSAHLVDVDRERNQIVQKGRRFFFWHLIVAVMIAALFIRIGSWLVKPACLIGAPRLRDC